MVSLALKCTFTEVCLPLQRARWPQRTGWSLAGLCHAEHLRFALLPPCWTHSVCTRSIAVQPRSSSPGTGNPLVLSAPCKEHGPRRHWVLVPPAAAELMPSTLAITVLCKPKIPGCAPQEVHITDFIFPWTWSGLGNEVGSPWLPSWHYSSCCNCTCGKCPYEYALVFPSQ